MQELISRLYSRTLPAVNVLGLLDFTINKVCLLTA